MSVESHIHALPRKAKDGTVYPEGVMIWDNEEKRLIIGDGETSNGIKFVNQSELSLAYTHTNIQLINGVTASNEAILKGEVLITHVIAPSGKIYVLADATSHWSGGYTYLNMRSYLIKEGMAEFEGTWKIAYQPLPQ